MKKLISLVALCLIAIAGYALGEDVSAVVFDDAYAITSFSGAHDMAYFIKEDGLYTLRPGEKEPQCVSAEIHSNRTSNGITHLFNDGNRLYGVSPSETALYLLTVDGVTFHKTRIETADELLKNKLQEHVAGYTAKFPVLGISNNVLYCTETSNEFMKITGLHLQTGQTNQTSFPEMEIVTAYENGCFAGIELKRDNGILRQNLVKIHESTGATDVLYTFDGTNTYRDLAYDWDTGYLYLLGDGRIDLWREETGVQPVTTILSGRAQALRLPGNNLFLAQVGLDSAAYILINASDEKATGQQLTVLDNNGYGSVRYQPFLKDYPFVNVQVIEDAKQSAEARFAEDMIKRSSDVDIYILSNANYLSVLQDKGYFVDMNREPVLNNAALALHEPFKDAFTVNGQTVAFPEKIQSETVVCHISLFETLGLTPPTTYEDFLDFHLSWLQNATENETDAFLYPIEYVLSLKTIMIKIADELERSKRAIEFNTPEIASLLDKYIQIIRLQEALGRYSLSYDVGEALFATRNIMSIEGDIAFLPLRLYEANMPIISREELNMQYFVINPYSQNAELALKFVAAYEPLREGYEMAELYQNVTDAIERADFQQELSHLSERLVAMNAQLEASEQADRQNLENGLLRIQEEMDWLNESGRWSVTQEALDYYRDELVQMVYINQFNPIVELFSGDEAETLMKVQNGELTVDAFLARLDQQVSQMLLERQ